MTGKACRRNLPTHFPKQESIHCAEVTHFLSEKYKNFHAPDSTLQSSANQNMALTRIVLHT